MKKYLAALFLALCAILTLVCCSDDTSPEIKIEFCVGDEVFLSKSYPFGEQVYTPDAKPTEDGFVFNGWYYDEGTWQRPFEPSDLNREFKAAEYKVYARFEHVSFKLNDDGKSYAVTGALEGAGENIVIPSKYLGKPVTAITLGAFADNAKIKTVKIPDSVTSVGQYAFARCASLLSVTLPNSDGLSVGNGAFSYCTALKSANLGATLKEIPAYGFEGCTALSEVTVYRAETVLGSAFKGCTALVAIELPDSIKKISVHAFEGCTALKAVALSRNVETVEDCAFFGCSALESITFKTTSGVTSVGKNAFTGTAITALSLPSLRTLGEDALPASLQSFSFGSKNLMYVHRRAFASLSADATVTFGSTVAEFEGTMKDDLWSEGRLVTITCEDGAIAP